MQRAEQWPFLDALDTFDISKSPQSNSSCSLDSHDLATVAGPSTDLCCPTPTSSIGSDFDLLTQSACQDIPSISDPSDWAEPPSATLQFDCPTPTSAFNLHQLSSQVRPCFCESSGFGGNEMDKVLCYLTSCNCDMGSHSEDVAGEGGALSDHNLARMNDTANFISVCAASPCVAADTEAKGSTIADGQSFACTGCVCGFGSDFSTSDSFAAGFHSPEFPSEAMRTTAYEERSECGAVFSQTRSGLKTDAPAFKPMPRQTARVEAVANAISLALLSSGHAQNLKVEHNTHRTPHAVVSAEVPPGERAASLGYNLTQLAKQATEAIAERLPDLIVLSSRIQKECDAYGLRLSIAGLPENIHNDVCWDLCSRGHCPRRDSCKWYHPRDDDIFRLKVSIRYSESKRTDFMPEQLISVGPSERHQISLGELIL